MLEAGIKRTAYHYSREKNTAAGMKSGTLAVLPTPAMIALIEDRMERVLQMNEEGCD